MGVVIVLEHANVPACGQSIAKRSIAKSGGCWSSRCATNRAERQQALALLGFPGFSWRRNLSLELEQGVFDFEHQLFTLVLLAFADALDQDGLATRPSSAARSLDLRQSSAALALCLTSKSGSRRRAEAALWRAAQAGGRPQSKTLARPRTPYLSVA